MTRNTNTRELDIFNNGYRIGIWFVSLITLVISLFVIAMNWYTGWIGILATGFVDFAGELDVYFSGIIAFTIIVNNLTLGYRVSMVWDNTGVDGLLEALYNNKSMRLLSFTLAVSYLADTATQVYAVVGTDYSILNVILSTLFSLFVFTVLSEVLFTTSLGILFGNWPDVKPLLTKMVASSPNSNNQHIAEPTFNQRGNNNTPPSTPPVFPNNPQQRK